ncbi:cell surface immobilization antigen SerH6, putative (macronuclear) [Tetrahymena thermophila SB210]|uniref:Cell surface immobilization antigen SerH6, putative n=1 Tax=Tetrahymena thermophila (strain SB210) TaxID=312017 RepID=Q22S87_TETTS|nr:cell surface immobilization antigen SerH6, putative [Tetrahymena thermophila SB210]EAR87885.3 cell surface immobilization antigen SerH6, putative [Tetrahymena thermophila SB210]|eukprot:XP_001008130.3 cell surface immobilization antigen SerH6, putative [Tetrahymena thermophila SB210]
MNSKIIFALFCLFAVSLATAGTTNIDCLKNGACNDANCGKSGAKTDNWQISGTQCAIADCSQLTASGATISTNASSGATISTNACTSCNTSASPAKTQASSDNSQCIVKSSAKLLIASAAIFAALFL